MRPSGARYTEGMGIYTFRQRKDDFFKTDPASPTEAADFGGLRYFPVAPALTFTLKLEPFAAPERLELVTSVGDVQPYLRYGRVRFTVGGESCTLTLFIPEADGEALSEHFFVPFKDATNGRETYGVGRYVEPVRLGDGNKVQLDFNTAYNPYCAYSESYRCPLPPAENRLGVAIRAGEKAYKVGG
ncbi:DUF1684 domain-containing protein [soil metagenome]